ncbi:MAG TPA: DUF4333 domain-containing protein [Baekduia sp.]|nr:DUF4333 domain-containing protein [Baekduia sp.]
MRHAAPAALLALSVVALSATACGGKVDRKDLESKIADFVHQQTGTTITVHCPDGVKPDKGTRVHCTTVLSGAQTDIQILFTDKGKFRITQMRPRIS